MRCIARVLCTLLAFASSLASGGVEASEVKVAVAANFTEPAKSIAVLFESKTGARVALSFGATGTFYAQIAKGAPFEVLLAADAATPARLVSEGHGVAGSTFTYAVGRLVLYSRTEGLITSEASLRDARISHLAIANPATAPYGAAALETLQSLGVWQMWEQRLVQGNSIAQAFQFVETGNTEAGFVALSQVALATGGSRWLVPSGLHRPIAQDAVLLRPGADRTVARAFLDHLKGPGARAVIERHGYAVGE